IASDNATFALPEPRVGLAALAGGLQRLPRQIGLKRAMGMILTARHVSAKEGLELGFVNEVVPAGQALAGAERWAETIAKNSPMSIRASKQAIQKGMAVSLEQAITEQREYLAVKAMAASQDYIEGPKAFAEKRPPKWLGEEATVGIAGEAKQSSFLPAARKLDCFVAALLAMTGGATPCLAPACTPRSSADRPRACPSWSARDAPSARACSNPPRRWRSSRPMRGSMPSTN